MVYGAVLYEQREWILTTYCRSNHKYKNSISLSIVYTNKPEAIYSTEFKILTFNHYVVLYNILTV